MVDESRYEYDLFREVAFPVVPSVGDEIEVVGHRAFRFLVERIRFEVAPPDDAGALPEETTDLAMLVVELQPRSLALGPNPSDVDYGRTFVIAEAFVDLRATDPEAARFGGRNETFIEWAAGVIEMSTGTVRAALRATGVIGEEGGSGSEGKGLQTRLLRLERFAQAEAQS